MTKSRHIALLLLISLTPIVNNCAQRQANQPSGAETASAAAKNQPDTFDSYLNVEFKPADGFDLPRKVEQIGGRGSPGAWRLQHHFLEPVNGSPGTGEDWSIDQNAAPETRFVFAVANGRVAFADDCGGTEGKVIAIDHVYYENNRRLEVRSVYTHLSKILVNIGNVDRLTPIAEVVGTSDKAAALHFELRINSQLDPCYRAVQTGEFGSLKQIYVDPGEFIRTHRKLFVPQREGVLLLINHINYKMRLYENAALTGEYDVSFGQGKEQKRLQGDNNTPRGMYFVTQKRRGKFDGPYGGYYGGHWIKLNYPNKYDAEWGVEREVILPAQLQSIASSWEGRKQTLESTPLGGGIGFHGWIKEWDNRGPRHLSWGCVVLHIYDITRLYDRIPEGAMVVIF